MLKFLVSTGLIVLGLAIGQALRIGATQARDIALAAWIRRLQLTALLAINPIITLGAFWLVRLDDPSYTILPVLGLAALALGGLLGRYFSHLLQHSRAKTGAMLVSSSFTNLGSFGGLICFVFFGEGSYAFVSMYKMFEEFFYYLIGYPLAKHYGTESGPGSPRHPLLRLARDPFILVYFVAITLGVALNVSGLPRPGFYQPLNSVLIPVSSLLLVLSVGYHMRFKAIQAYRTECLLVGAIKFAIIPLVITGAAWLLGVGGLQGGLVLKVVLVLSSMPPAFNSLIPPQIYGLDKDLANSCWLVGTGALILVLPWLSFLTQRL
jgi:predicted permease